MFLVATPQGSYALLLGCAPRPPYASVTLCVEEWGGFSVVMGVVDVWG